MPHKIIQAILQAQTVFVPFEEIGGNKQVSSIVVYSESGYSSFSLVDSPEKYLGPIGLQRADVPSESIRDWLSTQGDQCESVNPAKVNITESSFWLDGRLETVIELIDIASKDDRHLRMHREGSAYPYGLILES